MIVCMGELEFVKLVNKGKIFISCIKNFKK